MLPNIMLTYRCNLHCSYCFANEFVNKQNTDISIGNFLKAVRFITQTEQFIGIIGGEPTVHPGFQTMMELLIENPGVKGVRLFTNGILADRYIDVIMHPKVEVCVNCNSPKDIGEKTFDRLRQNLDLMMKRQSRANQVQLGTNLYSDDLDYTYITDLLQRYDQHILRTSLTVPDFSACGDGDVLEAFRKRKPFVLKFYRDLDKIGVLPFSDCNHPPYCIWTEEEKQWLEAFTAKYTDGPCKLVGTCSSCEPVIDILPDLQAVRCFGMSGFMKESIFDFESVRDLRRYFINEIDSAAYKLPACEECRDCREWKTRRCTGGCIGYKSGRIRRSNEATARL